MVRSRFDAVREVFDASLAAGTDLGASVAVHVDGRPVVDLWGGLADERTGRAWERDTACVTFSCTKALTATAALLLAERGAVDLHAPVATWWPEFGAQDKEAITGVRPADPPGRAARLRPHGDAPRRPPTRPRWPRCWPGSVRSGRRARRTATTR